jgi:hypothetical protein
LEESLGYSLEQGLECGEVVEVVVGEELGLAESQDCGLDSGFAVNEVSSFAVSFVLSLLPIEADTLQ